MKWSSLQVAELKDRWAAGQSMSEIAGAIGVTRNSIIGKSNRLNLQFHGGKAVPLAPNSGPAERGVTRFPSRVQRPGRSGVLKPGSNQRKLGAVVLKGRWRGLPIFSLTLEERATCPRSCKQWFSCYGNSSGRSVRYQHGDELLAAIFTDLMALERLHPLGIVVRLHQLGDFYSIDYVDFWRMALEEFPALRVFGYTARQSDDPIGAAVAALRDSCWDRFAVRTSGATTGPRTLVLETTESANSVFRRTGAIVCPAQTGKATHCGACALCWARPAMEKPVAFLRH